MAITITATVGSASANSYVTEAEFISLMATRLNVPAGTTVTGTTCTETEKAALIEATRELQMLPWVGTRVDTTQVLAWPREYAPKPDLPDEIAVGTDYYYLATEIPQLVKDAQIELAMEFVKAGTIDLAARDAALDVMREGLDVLETEYVPQAQRARGLARFPRVATLITPLLDDTEIGVMRVVRM